MAACGSWAKAKGIGASRMSEPLPADRASVGPGYDSRVSSNAARAARVVVPMSKQRPVLLRWPVRHHRQYRVS
jgi:hypothetical protein